MLTDVQKRNNQNAFIESHIYCWNDRNFTEKTPQLPDNSSTTDKKSTFSAKTFL